MLRKILERQGLTIFTEAQQLIEECHVDINIVANVFVKPRRRSWTVDCMLNLVILPLYISGDELRKCV